MAQTDVTLFIFPSFFRLKSGAQTATRRTTPQAGAPYFCCRPKRFLVAFRDGRSGPAAFPNCLFLTRFSVLSGRRGDWLAFVFGAALRGLQEWTMLRGMRWLIGALLVAGVMLVALNGICSRPSGFSGVAGFFCPRPKAVIGPRVPLEPPAAQKRN